MCSWASSRATGGIWCFRKTTAALLHEHGENGSEWLAHLSAMTSGVYFRGARNVPHYSNSVYSNKQNGAGPRWGPAAWV